MKWDRGRGKNALLLLLALAGLTLAALDVALPAFTGVNVLGLRYQRLSLFYYATITASTLTVSILLACLIWIGVDTAGRSRRRQRSRSPPPARRR